MLIVRQNLIAGEIGVVIRGDGAIGVRDVDLVNQIRIVEGEI